MKPNAAFQTAIRLESGRALIKVSGPIDEHSDFGPLLGALLKAQGSGASVAAFDLSEVHQINSIGVKKWIGFLEAIQRSFKLRFEKISEMIVAQANVISSMLGPQGTPVDTFSAPYLCDLCEKEFSRELKLKDLANDGAGGLKAPKLSCSCGGKLTFDEYEDEYFFFLQHTQAAQAD